MQIRKSILIYEFNLLKNEIKGYTKERKKKTL